MRNFLFFIAIIFFASFKHPFYMGVTDLKYNAKEKMLQGSIKLFTNDFEAALKKINKKTVDLINTKNKEETNIIVVNYLKTHFSLKINGKPVIYQLIGFESEQEAIWMYIEFDKSELPKKIEIENILLFDFIKEQINIVHLEVNNSKKSLKVTNPEKNLIFDF